MGDKVMDAVNWFKQDTVNHTMKVLKDDGVYRHLVFSRDGSSCFRWEIITSPNLLVFTGDMDTFVFSRLNDMFDFFGGTSYGYYAEKCIAEGTPIKEFKSDKLKEYCISCIKDWCEDYEINPNKVINDFCREFDYTDTNPTRMYDFLNEYEYEIEEDNIFTFHDVWDWFSSASETYSFHYIWCIEAINYSIEEYNKYKGNK